MSKRKKTTATIAINGKDFVSLSTDILKKKGTFTFKAFGHSMWPFIKPGDILVIQPVEPATIKIGDVVFSQMSDSKITVHRIISIDPSQKSAVMRGDSANSGGEAISFTQIFGKVIQIKKNNKTINLDQHWRKRLIFLWYLANPIKPFLLNLRKFARHTFGWFILQLTPFNTYRKFQRMKLANKVHYQQATNADNDRFEYPTSPDNSQLQPPNASNVVHYSLKALYKHKVIGTITLVKFPESYSLYPDWWIFGMKTRIPFRGAGIGNRLLQLCLTKAQNEKGSTIYLMVETNNIAARALYTNAGFTPTTLPPLSAILEDEAKRGLGRRIILKKNLSLDSVA